MLLQISRFRNSPSQLAINQMLACNYGKPRTETFQKLTFADPSTKSELFPALFPSFLPLQIERGASELQLLLFLSIPLFTGMTKYGERLWVLRAAAPGRHSYESLLSIKLRTQSS
uniref:Uncharacterized protein n=1 Tax=Salix viminalis TaxID=40686 RepID=A0A6N2NA27_SALVM